MPAPFTSPAQKNLPPLTTNTPADILFHASQAQNEEDRAIEQRERETNDLATIKKKPAQILAWTIWFLVVSTMFAVYMLILRYPIREPPNLVDSALLEGVPAASIVLTNVYLLISYFRRNPRNIIRAVSLIVLTILLAVASSDRAFDLERIMWQFDGVVADKYRSTNHGALSIQVKGHGSGRYEYFDESFWNAVEEGDHIKKEEFSLYALVKGEKRICVRSYLLKEPRGRYLKARR